MVTPDQAETFTLIVDRSNLKDLSPETLLAAFQAEGIRSLEDLTASLSQALQERTGQAERIHYADLFREPTPSEVLKSIVQRVPEAPIIVDGEERDPREISRFDGVELGFIPQDEGKSLLLLTDKATWAPFVRTLLISRAVTNRMTSSALESYQYGGYTFVTPRNGPTIIVGQPAIAVGPTAPDPAPPWLTLWRDINLSGSALTLYSGESRRDLTRVSWSIFGGSWNDRISSVGRTSSLCLAFEHIHFQGGFFWLGPNGVNNFDLHMAQWGDRISSVINAG